MIKANYISTDEFKSWNPETDLSAYNVTTLSGMITRASAWVDDHLNYSLKVENITNEINSDAKITSDGDLVIFPKKIPIVSVSKIELKLGSYASELSLTDGDGNLLYDIPDPEHHILYPFQTIQATGTLSISSFYDLRTRQFYVRLTYRAGYATIPDAIKDATNLVVMDILVRAKNPIRARNVSQGGISMAFKVGDSGLILDAKRLLDSYKKVV